MDDIVQEFLIESYEGLERLEQDLVTLERTPEDFDLIGAIFRNLHTIKGCCGYLGFDKLEQVAHAGESLLGRLRDGEMKVTAAVTDALLLVTDTVRDLLTNIESSGSEGDTDVTPATAATERILSGADEAPEEAPAAEEEEDSDAPAGKKTAAVANSTIRVDVGLLDELMNLVGELVLARNQLLQHIGQQSENALLNTGQRMNHITTELQARIMKTRMQPIGNVWHKLPRLVRDTSAVCNKQASLSMAGQDTELDRTILQAIRDPLTHIVRNAIDHGIEPPEVRLSRGKPAEGRLVLQAFHEGGQVNIELIDDGAGVDVERVRERARERGLVASDVLTRMSAHEVTQLIFHPGFSTAAAVTNVSGRGVGMDVVKTNVEQIGGQVEIDSTFGQGTTIRIRIPLTLAIIPALIVTGSQQRFALPQISLDELVRLEGTATRAVETIRGIPIYRLRGRLLPLVHLHEALALPPPPEVPEEDRELNIVVLKDGDRKFGLVVDAILDTEEIVVKPLSGPLKKLGVYAGSTIMGDGRVALILDSPGLARQAGLNVGSTARTLERLSRPEDRLDSNIQTLLVLQIAHRRVAMPLSAVSRLEEFPRSSLEKAGQDMVVQYRGGIMPLVNLGELLHCQHSGISSEEDHPVRVVVRSVESGVVGLVVDQILDIVSESFQLHPVDTTEPLLGYAVIQSRVTELLDIEALLRKTRISMVRAA